MNKITNENKTLVRFGRTFETTK